MRDQLIIAARSLVGSPFHWHQRGPFYDCLGLILKPLWEVGIVPEDFDFKDYGNRPGRDLIPQLTGVGSQWLETTDDPRHGDIQSYYVGRDVAHLGWIDGDFVIHADIFRGVVREYAGDLRLKPAIAFRVLAQ